MRLVLAIGFFREKHDDFERLPVLLDDASHLRSGAALRSPLTRHAKLWRIGIVVGGKSSAIITNQDAAIGVPAGRSEFRAGQSEPIAHHLRMVTEEIEMRNPAPRPQVVQRNEQQRFSEMSYGFAIVFHKNPGDVEECCRYIDSFWQHDMELDEHGSTAIQSDIPEPALGREYATRNLPAPMSTEELAGLARQEVKALFFFRYEYSTRFFRKGGEHERLASLDDFLAWRTINGALEYPCYIECPHFHHRLARHMTLLNDLFDFPRDRKAGSPNLVSYFGGDVQAAIRFFNDSLDGDSELLQSSEAMNAYFRYLYWQVDPKSQRDRGSDETHYEKVLGLLRIKAPGADYLYLNEARRACPAIGGERGRLLAPKEQRRRSGRASN